MSVHQNSEVYSKIKELLEIPVNEPIFIIRAQDKYSIKTIKEYMDIVQDHTAIGQMRDWFAQVGSIINDFLNWQRDNRDKVKVPD